MEPFAGFRTLNFRKVKNKGHPTMDPLSTCLEKKNHLMGGLIAGGFEESILSLRMHVNNIPFAKFEFGQLRFLK